MNDIILQIENLSIDSLKNKTAKPIVKNCSFSLQKDKITCLVGESGSGKTMTVRSILGVLPEGLYIKKGSLIENHAKSIYSIFQDPMSSFNPVIRIKKQLYAMARGYLDIRKEDFELKISDILRKLNFHNPKNVLRKYPFELSGGMLQRLMIANAMLIQPDIIIADEPTTALDVTVQREILKQFRTINKQLHTTLLFVTHDFGVVAEIADEVYVMYRGEIVEQNDVYSIFEHPKNEYTKMLIKATQREV